MNKGLPYFILLLFCVPLFFFNIWSSQPWGDDYAQYIKEAQNIATGHPYYQSNYIFNELNTGYAPPQYPPGFPILLAPVIKIWGLAIKPMLYLITIILSGILFAFYFYFRKHCGTVTALCLSLVGVYSASLIGGKHAVLSDIPCLFFVTVYLALRQSSRFNLLKQVLLIFIGVYAILIRTQVILLPLAELCFSGIEMFRPIKSNRNFSLKNIYQPISFRLGIGMLLLLFLVNRLVFPTPVNLENFYLHIYANQTHDYWRLIGNNLNYLDSLFQIIFTHNTWDPFFQAPSDLIGYAALIFIWIGFLLSVRRQIRMEDIFFTLMCLLILVTPVYQGVRYIFPAMPVFLLYVKRGLGATIPRAFGIKPVVLAIVFTVTYLALGHDDCEQATHQVKDLSNTAYKPEDSSAFAYLEKNISDKDIILFSKPRALTLYTNKRSMNLSPQVSNEINKRKVDSMGIKYLLWADGVSEDYFKNYLYQTHSNIDSVTINDRYKLYRLR